MIYPGAFNSELSFPFPFSFAPPLPRSLSLHFLISSSSLPSSSQQPPVHVTGNFSKEAELQTINSTFVLVLQLDLQKEQSHILLGDILPS